MLKRRITKAAEKAMDNMPDKQFCQLYDSIESLRVIPDPQDSQELISKVTPRRRRKDVGEYRIIYYYDDTSLYIDLIGKRNDKDVYRKARQKRIL